MKDRFISVESQTQILKINNPVNKVFFVLFNEYVVEYKTLSNNQAIIEKLPNKEQLSNLLLIKYRKMKQINFRIPVKEY